MSSFFVGGNELGAGIMGVLGRNVLAAGDTEYDLAQRRATPGDYDSRYAALPKDVAKDPEGHLLEISTSMDISGRRTEDISPDLRADVLARYPRLGLGEEFIG